MKTSIWATCPKCQTELKIVTDETEIVQIDCPDCHKVFAARVPPPSAAPVHEVFAQTPVLPPFQPARVHYKSRAKSNDSMNPAMLTALIVVCASAILIPLGFGGYYIYGKLSEGSELGLSNSPVTSRLPTVRSSQSSSAPASEAADVTANFQNLNTQTTASRQPSSQTDTFPNTATPETPMQTETTAPTFGVRELNPPPLIQSPPTTPTTPDTPLNPNSGPMTAGPMTPGNSNPSQGQVSVSGPGTSQSGLPVQLQRFTGPSGVFIFVLHSKGYSVSNSAQELVRNLSVNDMHIENGGDHTTVGIRYSGTIDSVVKGIRFGKVSYVDEESRSIHVNVN